MGNSMGRAPWGRSDTEATRGWTEGKPWEVAWGELRWEGAIRKRREGGRKGNRGNSLGRAHGGKERYGSDDRVDRRETVGNRLGRAPVERYGSDDKLDGRKTVGNSLGRAPVGRSDTGMTTGWTEGKPWEIAWGELRWEGAMREGRQGGRKGNRGK